MLPILIILSLIVLIVAAFTDFKTLEVPDWLNFSALAAGLGIHIILSFQQLSFSPFLASLFGLLFCLVLACFMFYTGQWGGGDAKLLIAMGAIIGFQAKVDSFLISFVINIILIGALWGIIYSVALSFKHKKEFIKKFKSLFKQKVYFNLFLSGFVFFLLSIIIGVIYRNFFLECLLIGLFMWLLAFFALFVKAVELSCMYKQIPPNKLVEGDWLVKDIKINNKLIVKKRKLGLDKSQIKKIKRLFKKKKLKTVLIRYGIPFTPAFLFSFIITYYTGNLIFLFFQSLM